MSTTTLNPTVKGDVYDSRVAWPVNGTGIGLGGTQYALGRGFNGSQYYQYNWLLRFDTSSIAADAISSAKLRLYTSSVTAADTTTGIAGEYYDPGASVDAGDFTATIGTTAFSSATLVNGAYVEITLTSPDANINKSGFTGFRIQARDFGTPTGSNLSAIDVTTNLVELVIVHALPTNLTGMSGMSGMSGMH